MLQTCHAGEREATGLETGRAVDEVGGVEGNRREKAGEMSLLQVFSYSPPPPCTHLLTRSESPRTPQAPPSFLSSCCLRANSGTAAPCQLLLPPQPPACMPSSPVSPSLLGRFRLTSSLTSFFMYLFFWKGLTRSAGCASVYVLKKTHTSSSFSPSPPVFSLVPTWPPPISISGRHAAAAHRETRCRAPERQF